MTDSGTTAWDGTLIAVTPRLILRTFRRDDLPLYAALNSDPAVYEFLGGEPLSKVDSDDIAAWAQDLYAAEGIGLSQSNVARTALSSACAACTIRSPTRTRSRSAGGWPTSTGATATPPRRQQAGSTTASAHSP